MALFVSDQAHYSFEKATNVLGIGHNSVVKVATDLSGRMIPDELNRSIEKNLESGKMPFFVVATAGTTVTGSFDPIERLAEIAGHYGIWLHVDGALGASVLLSKQHKHLLDGIHLANSVAWNAHKTMGVPLLCSALLLRDVGVLEESTSCDHSNYLFHDEASYDMGKKSLQCGRRVDALKLWLSWKYFGDIGYDERVSRLFMLASYAEELVNADPRLDLVAPVESVNVCFQYVSENGSENETNIFNRRIRDHLLKSGLSAVNYATIDGRTTIRIAFVNPDIDREDVDRFFHNVHDAAKAVEFRA